MGCHNINFVTPEHVVPQILEALPLAVEGGLRLPLVYNTSAYDSMDSLGLLDGIVDIYMPDFKFWDARLSLRYLLAKDYPEAARRAVQEMHRQVGPLKLDENGVAKRGVLVRHLVMPGEIAGTEHIMRFLTEEISPDTYVNVMEQYRPAGRVSSEKFEEINRRVNGSELQAALNQAQEAGLWRFDEHRSPPASLLLRALTRDN
jgi:putative pyruvate formate lyase activating enzyme